MGEDEARPPRYSCNGTNSAHRFVTPEREETISAAPTWNNLKEDRPVDISTTTMTGIQLTVIWTLLGFLLAWMILFALLALRPETKQQTTPEEITIPAPHTLPATPPVPSMLQILAAPRPTATTFSRAGGLPQEVVEQVETSPVSM